MTVIKQAPEQPILKPGKFDWEEEATRVDERKRLIPSIIRFFRTTWFWLLLIGIVMAALLSEDVMRGIIPIMGAALQVVLLILIFLSQFILMFWFLSRSRQYTIMPGAEGVSFKDYRGQPEVLEQAMQIVTLLRGVKAFEGAGG
ncbi:MAG: hypothetical protein CUN53_12495, partial [Phototrophicales bacterium]